jgi:hypothetical protein
MAAESSDGLGGRPGDRWRNMTDDTWYQLVASLRKSCTVCVRRHGRISPRPWPIPFHLHCECTQLPILPGGQAPLDFAAPALLAAAMPVGGQVELVGALNWLIRSAGLVSWDDLFDGNGDPRDFDDVVRRKGLTLEQLRRAGVAEGVARRAVGARFDGEVSPTTVQTPPGAPGFP